VTTLRAWLLGALLASLVLALLYLAVSCTVAQPDQRTGIELDIDRAKPRKTLKPKLKNAAPVAPRKKVK
jgi:hypothetical protein